MKNIKSLILILFAFVSLSIPMVAMAESNAFVVKNYEVNYKRFNHNTIREKALKNATKTAFSKLLRQLTPYETWNMHSRLIAYTNWDKVAFKTKIISEEYGSVYKAVFDIYYRPKAVKELLTSFNIPYSESTGGKVLILPVFEMGGNKQLWETVNPLRDIVAKNMRAHSYFDYILPVGNIEETSALSSEMATLGAGDLILNIAKNYEASAAVVFYAKISQRFGRYYLDVTASWFENNQYIEPSLFSAPIDNIAFIDGEVDESSLNSTFKLAVNDILSRLGTHKRQEHLVEVNKPGRVFLRFKPADARDLEKLKEKIAELNTIREFKLRVLNVKDSVFQVDFYGDKLTFKNQLKQLNLSVAKTSMPMVWKVQFMNDPFIGPVDYSFDQEEKSSLD